MGFIETSYGSSPNLSQVNIDSNLNMDTFGISAGGAVSFSGGLDLNNTDLVGVKRFMCEDYLGAIITTASDTEKEVLILNDIGGAITKKFRIPSNIVAGSSIRVKFYAKNTLSSDVRVSLRRYDPETETTVIIDDSLLLPPNAENWYSVDIPSCSAGEYYCIMTYYSQATIYGESKGVKMCFDDTIYTSGLVWDVIP